MAFTDAQKDLVEQFALQVGSSDLLNPDNVRANGIQDAWRQFEKARAAEDWDAVRGTVVSIARSQGMDINVSDFDADLFRTLLESDVWEESLSMPSIESSATNKFRARQAEVLPAPAQGAVPSHIDEFQRSMLALKKIGDENGNAKYGVEQLSKSLGVAGLAQPVQNALLKAYLDHPELLSKSHVNSTVAKLRELVNSVAQTKFLSSEFAKAPGVVVPFSPPGRAADQPDPPVSADDAPVAAEVNGNGSKPDEEKLALEAQVAEYKAQDQVRDMEEARLAEAKRLEEEMERRLKERALEEEERRRREREELKRELKEGAQLGGGTGGGGGNPLRGLVKSVTAPFRASANAVAAVGKEIHQRKHEANERRRQELDHELGKKLGQAYESAPDHLADSLKSFSSPASVRIVNANDCALSLSAEVDSLRAHPAMRAIIEQCQLRAGSSEPEAASEFFEKLSLARPESDDGKLNANITRAFETYPELRDGLASFGQAFRKYKAAHGLAADSAMKEGDRDMLDRLNRIHETTLQQASWIPGEDEKKREEYAKGLVAMAKRVVEMLKSAFGRKSGIRAA